jgi:hypothetical protein
MGKLPYPKCQQQLTLGRQGRHLARPQALTKTNNAEFRRNTDKLERFCPGLAAGSRFLSRGCIKLNEVYIKLYISLAMF